MQQQAQRQFSQTDADGRRGDRRTGEIEQVVSCRNALRFSFGRPGFKAREAEDSATDEGNSDQQRGRDSFLEEWRRQNGRGYRAECIGKRETGFNLAASLSFGDYKPRLIHEL